MTFLRKIEIKQLLESARFDKLLFVAEIMLAIGLLLLSGTFLILNLDVGIWADELHSLRYANPSKSFVDNYIHFAQRDAHPPFYVLSLYLWFQVLPYGEISARLLGITVAGIIFIFVLYHNIIDDRKVILRFYLLLYSCFFVLVYIIEIRSYTFLISISSISAIGLYRLSTESDNMAQLKSAKMYLLVSLFLMTATHVWGLLFSSAIIATLPFARKVGFNFKFLGLCALAVLFGSPGIIFIAHQILTNSTLGEDLLRFVNSDLIGLKLLATMISEFGERFLVTTRSKFLFLLALAALIYFAGWRQFISVKCLLTAIVFLILGVTAISIFVGSIYRAYAMVIFIPYIFLALSILISTPRINKIVSLMIVLGFVAANFGSVPFFEGLPDKPMKIKLVGDTAITFPRNR